jgi:hypothetical protein
MKNYEVVIKSQNKEYNISLLQGKIIPHNTHGGEYYKVTKLFSKESINENDPNIITWAAIEADDSFHEVHDIHISTEGLVYIH